MSKAITGILNGVKFRISESSKGFRTGQWGTNRSMTKNDIDFILQNKHLVTNLREHKGHLFFGRKNEYHPICFFCGQVFEDCLCDALASVELFERTYSRNINPDSIGALSSKLVSDEYAQMYIQERL